MMFHMGRVGVIGSMLILVAGCRYPTPYQPMGYRGGYSDEQLGNGDYLVKVKVNGFTSSGTAFEYLHRRAGELCPSGYDIIDRSSGDNGGLLVTQNYVSSVHKPEVDAVVRCKRAVAVIEPVRGPTETPPQQVTSGREHAWLCTVSAADGLATACMSDADACDRIRAERLEGTPDLSACVPVDAVSCFTYTDKSDTSHRRRCAPSRVTCTQQLADALAKPDAYGDVSDCKTRN
jgi:hypothetical protein